ncbi:hypothetical protein SISNIDRAFT_456032 [Sistotremastrum niveocremeum HHB9708]|uniref:Association with the SNF1 complex (ASC) domain-containing protein n=1 Tax=Sistotremastrum niveocremeum HHB9708 TaxID=1314777 RepID=A0A164TDG1_9AGAM|nr:hypothetical protein SISNIDRAFT_456032 [Sistotremastrum niveocremeum HHB9708]
MGNHASKPPQHPDHRSPAPTSSTSSTPSNNPAAPASPAASSAPPHRARTGKKKTLELPDLASLTAIEPPSTSLPPPPTHLATTSAPIPIPGSSASRNRSPGGVSAPSYHPPVEVTAPPTHIPPRPPPVKEEEDEKNVPPAPDVPARRTGAERPRATTQFHEEIVKSMLPNPLKVPSDSDESERNKVPVKIVWKEPAKVVHVTGTFDGVPWRRRTKLTYDPSQNLHSVYLQLSPGTHRLKFILDDDVYACSSEYTTATDNDGNLVNVLDIPFPSPTTAGTEPGSLPRSEILAPLSPAEEGEAGPSTTRKKKKRAPRERAGDQFLSSSDSWTDGSDGSSLSSDSSADAEKLAGSLTRPKRKIRRRRKQKTAWTSTPPPALYRAAQLEETFLASPTSPTHSVILQLIPPAPTLPRYLDKVILNVPTSKSSRRPPPSIDLGFHLNTPAKPSPVPSPAAFQNVPLAPQLGQGAINTREDLAGAGDDKSVLPVPNHVILHHLGTSAIRNGVLAVEDTIRYRQKFITTIYYKPTLVEEEVADQTQPGPSEVPP